MGYQALDRVIEELKECGFVERFDVRGGQLRAEDLAIREYQRLEGVSDPDDASIVYALDTRSRAKGLLVDAFGPCVNPEVGRLLETVEIHARAI